MLSALRGLTLGGHLSANPALEAVADFLELRIRRERLGVVAKEVWRRRNQLTACEAAYLVVVETLGQPLWTRDQRMARALPSVIVV